MSRYIEKTLKCGYNGKQIFVVYLSQYPKEPEPQSWGNYQDSFRSRYVNLSYCYDVLPWLKDKVRPNIKDKELLLRTAIIQYIDYLEGLFRIREIDKTMNMELNNLIEKHLDLISKTEIEKVDELMNEIRYVEEVVSQMKVLLETSRQSIFEQWQEQTRTKYRQFMPNNNTEKSKGWFITDVTIKMEDKETIVYLGEDSSNIYCGFCFNMPIEERRQYQNDANIIKERLELTQSNDKEEIFVSYFKEDKDSYNIAWNRFREVVEVLTNPQ